jgi:hypothetical protein
MELPSVAALEFEQIKASIKNYIKTKTDFQDYDFEGSNLSMLVDVLAYNTMYTSYNANMIANELNLDTAVIRDNVVSHAKKLGYTPNSYTSSKVLSNITVNNVSQYESVQINPGPIFSVVQNNQSYTYISRNPVSINTNNSGSVIFENLSFVEGLEFTIQYTVDESNENQRFFVPNNFVDMDSITVSIIADETGVSLNQQENVEDFYTRKNSIVGVTSSDKVFFVEEVQDQKYEIIFGDNVIGRKLENGEIIIIRYVVTSGSKCNNFTILPTNFIGTIVGTRTGVSDTIISSSDIVPEILGKTDGGSEFEDIKSIKYRAPRWYSSQQRAVTPSDYESIIQNIYTNADLVNITGGEKISPPQFGKVFICIKPKVGDIVSQGEKIRIVNEVKDYIVGSITPVVLDAIPFYIEVEPIIVYDQTKTRKTLSQIKSLVDNAILKFNLSDDFKNFGGIYSSAKLLCDLEGIDSSIKYILIRTLYRRVVKLYNSIEFKYELDFYSKLKSKVSSKYTLISDLFCIKQIAEPVFLCSLSDDFSGCDVDKNIYLSTVSGRIISKVGEIDYDTGKVYFTITSCQDTPINIYVIPVFPDVTTGFDTFPVLTQYNYNIVDVDDMNNDTLNPEPVLPVPANDSSGDPSGLPAFDNIPGTTTVNPDGSVTTVNSDGSTTTVNPDGSTFTTSPEDGTGAGDGEAGTDENINPTLDTFTPETKDICS